MLNTRTQRFYITESKYDTLSINTVVPASKLCFLLMYKILYTGHVK